MMIFACFTPEMPVKLFNNVQNEGVATVCLLPWLLLFTLPLPLACFALTRRQAQNSRQRQP
ncbi:hypothetical protein [Pantoea brenneri]|uniref:hypothetical protein n=1 Tax=Pantoea brenneri TaxID=472694 RepID=UPI0028A02D07|nr:hypothetical protein [Pantoea brenneri]